MRLFQKIREVKLLIMGRGNSKSVAESLVIDNIHFVKSAIDKGIDPRDIARNIAVESEL